MTRSIRVRRVTRLLAALFLLVAAGEAALALLPLADPRLLAAGVECSPSRCRLAIEPLRLLPRQADAGLPQVTAPAVEQAIGEPRARLLLFLSALVRRLPQALLFACLAFALRRLGRARPFRGNALLWLRRAATAAVAAVLAQPLADTLRATALSPLLTGRFQTFILFEGPPFLWGLLLAGGVWACVWAMEEARRVEAELAEIV